MSDWINFCTYGLPRYSLSHVGIVGKVGRKVYLFESTMGCTLPCALQGSIIAGVQAHNIEDRIANYNGKVWHYPLATRLTRYQSRKLNTFLIQNLGKAYDDIGAFRAGGIGWSWIESWFHPANLTSLFCSELCCAGLVTASVFCTDHVSRWSPNRLVRAVRRAGVISRPIRKK